MDQNCKVEFELLTSKFGKERSQTNNLCPSPFFSLSLSEREVVWKLMLISLDRVRRHIQHKDLLAHHCHHELRRRRKVEHSVCFQILHVTSWKHQVKVKSSSSSSSSCHYITCSHLFPSPFLFVLFFWTVNFGEQCSITIQIIFKL